MKLLISEDKDNWKLAEALIHGDGDELEFKWIVACLFNATRYDPYSRVHKRHREHIISLLSLNDFTDIYHASNETIFEGL